MVHELTYLPQKFLLETGLLDQLSSRMGCQRCILGQHGEMLLVVHEVPEPGVPERKALFFWYDSSKEWHGSVTDGLVDLQKLLERYAQAIDVHEAVVDDADTAKEIFTILRHAGPLARSTRNLFLCLQEAAALFPKDKELRSLRDRAHENERAAELLYADARLPTQLDGGIFPSARSPRWIDGDECKIALLCAIGLLVDLFRRAHFWSDNSFRCWLQNG